MLMICELEICTRIGWAVLLLHRKLLAASQWYSTGSWTGLEVLRKLCLHIQSLSREGQKARFSWAAPIFRVCSCVLSSSVVRLLLVASELQGKFSKKQEVEATGLLRAESVNR